MAGKKAEVRVLQPHPALKYPKNWSGTQDDTMGKQMRLVNLVFPAETDDKGNPKGEDQTITVFANGAPATVGEGNVLAVPPHIDQWCRLLVANHVSGDTEKGQGYSMTVVYNLKEFEEDTIKKLISRGASIEATWGKREKRFYATFEQLFTEAVLQASIIQQTAERWPEAKEVAKAVVKETTPPVEVSFTL
ncbi:MAG: hypothetical protein GTO24_08465 [candidate division Zixibacteria bacterium]|nr:hypothetical protein [candidate division Zixibacteria bacterium]